jgi:hypothetical protein
MADVLKDPPQTRQIDFKVLTDRFNMGLPQGVNTDVYRFSSGKRTFNEYEPEPLYRD